MKLFVQFVIVLACLMEHSVAAVTSEWLDCVREAAVSNQRLQSARQAIFKAEHNKKSADSVYLPTINAAGGASLNKSEDVATDHSSSYGVSASQLIYDFGRSKSQTQTASALVESAENKYQLASATVRYRLRSSYINLLKAQELLDITGRIAERRQKSARLIKLRYEAGREHKGSLLTSEAKQMQAELQQKKALRDLDLSRYLIAVELGRDTLGTNIWKDIQVKGEMLVNYDDSLMPDFDAILKDVPDLKDLLIQSRLAKYDMEAAKSDFYPIIKARAGADENSDGWNDYGNSFSAGVTLSIPLFEGWRSQAKYNSAKAALSIAGHDEFNGRNDLSSALRRKWSAFKDSIDRARLARMFYEAAKERARISLVQYSSGIVNYDNWIIIEDEYINSEQSLLDANASAMNLESEWINVKGGTLEQEYK